MSDDRKPIDVPPLTEEDMARVRAALEAEEAAAVKCLRCFHRADEPYGNGTLCMVCAARPTGEGSWRIVGYGRCG